MKKELKFPTILGLLVLLLGTAAGIFLMRRNSNQNTNATGSCDPTSIQVTNITDKSSDISFLTSSACNATISVNNSLISDIRSAGSSSNFAAKTHYFQVDDLKANTNYTYTVVSGGNTYNNTNYQFKTAQKPSSAIPTSNLAWGKIYNSDHTPASTAIIYINIPGASPLSAYITSNGNWNISLANSFDTSKANWFTPDPNTDEDITVVADNQDPVVFTGNTSYNNPVPDIILGETTTLNFPKTTPTLPISPTASPTTALVAYGTLSITSPIEGEYIAGVSPQFLGTANAGSQVSLQLTSTSANQSFTTTAGADGSWSWPLAQTLSATQYTLTAVSNGTTVTRIFYVSAAVGGPAFVSSPSATIAVTPTTIMPANTPFITDTPFPTERASHPSTSSGVPVTGVMAPTIIITLLGVISTFAGILILK
ncbi:Ig-like domain-containing protein [Patescibacteria group bacterium]|nr:Ig-like domain-containing protein [Patescibacteria group bacterium]